MASDVMHVNGWERWHDWQARVMAPVVDWYVDATAARRGDRILDAACGTGLPALALAERVGPTGRVVATDLEAAMTGATARKARALGLANVEVHERDTASLGFEDASFDAASCKDGLVYARDPVAAARELARVVRPGGRIAVSAWSEPAENPFFTTLFGTAMRFVPRPPPGPDAPGPFRLAAPGQLEATLQAAGVTPAAVVRRELAWTFTSLDHHWAVVEAMAAPLAAAAVVLLPDELAALRAALAEALRPFTRPGGEVVIPGVARCASAIR